VLHLINYNPLIFLCRNVAISNISLPNMFKNFKYFSWLQKHLTYRAERKMRNLQQSLIISYICATTHGNILYIMVREKGNTNVQFAAPNSTRRVTYHIILHIQKDKVKCTGCDKLYKTSKLMKAHYNDIHLNLKNFKCLNLKVR